MFDFDVFFICCLVLFDDFNVFVTMLFLVVVVFVVVVALFELGLFFV
jgi:hypothetical protein